MLRILAKFPEIFRKLGLEISIRTIWGEPKNLDRRLPFVPARRKVSAWPIQLLQIALPAEALTEGLAATGERRIVVPLRATAM